MNFARLAAWILGPLIGTASFLTVVGNEAERLKLEEQLNREQRERRARAAAAEPPVLEVVAA